MYKRKDLSEAYNNFVSQVRVNAIAILPNEFDYVVEDIDAAKFKDDIMHFEGDIKPIIL